jgi:hypothetical protein
MAMLKIVVEEMVIGKNFVYLVKNSIIIRIFIQISKKGNREDFKRTNRDCQEMEENKSINLLPIYNFC